MRTAYDIVPPRRARRVLVVFGPVVLAVLLVGIGLFGLTEHVGDDVARLPRAFTGLDQSARPASAGALTFLLVGTDSRSSDPTTGTDATAPGFVAGAARSDALMIAQVSPDRRRAAVVSIPRDSWVDVPGHGSHKINAAYSIGGPPLLIQTVEQLSGVRIDHFAIVDFAGFQSVVDAMGGIDVVVATPTSSAGITFHAGVNHLDGASALVYVRQRHELPGGDLSRALRQQNVLRAVLTGLVTNSTLTDPIALWNVVDAVSGAVTVDDTLTNDGLRGLALDLASVRPRAVTFLRAPVGSAGREGGQDVLYLDPTSSRALWAALRGGDIAGYATNHPGDQLGPAPS